MLATLVSLKVWFVEVGVVGLKTLHQMLLLLEVELFGKISDLGRVEVIGLFLIVLGRPPIQII